MTLIYFAAPLFNEAEKTFNLDLTQKCENLGFSVFLPQRDGLEINKEPYTSMLKEKQGQDLFFLNRNKVMACNIFLYILDGRVPDEGAAVELGIAYTDQYLRSKNRLLIGLHTDMRSAFFHNKVNPMLKIPLNKIFSTTVDLLNFLSSLPK